LKEYHLNCKANKHYNEYDQTLSFLSLKTNEADFKMRLHNLKI